MISIIWYINNIHKIFTNKFGMPKITVGGKGILYNKFAFTAQFWWLQILWFITISIKNSKFSWINYYGSTNHQKKKEKKLQYLLHKLVPIPWGTFFVEHFEERHGGYSLASLKPSDCHRNIKSNYCSCDDFVKQHQTSCFPWNIKFQKFYLFLYQWKHARRCTSQTATFFNTSIGCDSVRESNFRPPAVCSRKRAHIFHSGKNASAAK